MALAQQEKHPQVVDRTYLKARDQHGRKWGAVISKKTMAPVGPLEPQDWRAPWQPHPTYVHWRYDAEEGVHSVFIDYDAMVRDCDTALRAWNQRLIEVGLKVNGSAFDSKNPSPEVLTLVGPKPRPRELPLAAKAGDPWILGAAKDKPRWARAFFPESIENPLWFLDQTDDEQDEETVAVVPAAAPVKRGPGRPRKSEG